MEQLGEALPQEVFNELEEVLDNNNKLRAALLSLLRIVLVVELQRRQVLVRIAPLLALEAVVLQQVVLEVNNKQQVVLGPDSNNSNKVMAFRIIERRKRLIR